jgi:addiction module HigA family antidote
MATGNWQLATGAWCSRLMEPTPCLWITATITEANMTRMHNPPHPGEVLRAYLGDITITEAALKLGVNRVTLSRVVSGSSGISADMAYRLAQAFGTSAEMWAGMQMQYELYQASKIKRPMIDRLAA